MIPEPLKEYWRVGALVLLVALSLGLVFGVVGFGGASDGGGIAADSGTVEESSLTTLRFGLELAGGTRIRAPLHGQTAEGIEYDTNTNLPQLERDVAAHLDGADPADVNTYPRFDEAPADNGAIEVTSESVTADEFKAALDAEGIEYEEVRSGVTAETREETVRVVNNKINHAGLSGGTAREVRTSTGEHFILVEVPDQGREEVISLIEERGQVQVDIYYPVEGENGTVYETKPAVLEQGDFQRIGTATTDERLGPHVPVVLREGAAQRFHEDTLETGLARGGSRCYYEEDRENSQACLLTKVDGEVVYSAGMSPDLARSIESGEWLKDPSFVLQTEDRDEAQELSLHLRAGALPAQLNMDRGTSTYVSPTQGEHFKKSGILIGLLAVLAVAGKVAIRYRDVRVAAPMVATASCEVLILCGVAAFLGYPIDLAVIGGFIAVVGTGVDDLIIIANEVLAKGDVTSQTVFDTRFSKAFWVIGAAALTTGIAMSPLIVMSLGDLRGFAIFTIIGITIGVFITRPAYGDVLNYLLIDEKYD